MTTVEIVAAGNKLLMGDGLDINTNWLCRGITGLCERMHHTSVVKVTLS